jgi:hypothetical protein
MKRFIFLMVCGAILSGCATTQMLKPEQPPELVAKTDKALLVIIRDTYFGGAIVFWNYLDDHFIGETMGNTYFITDVDPGRHYVVVETENTCVADLTFEAGKRYFLREGITIGWWRARTSGFSPVSANEAMQSVKKLTYLERDPNGELKNIDPKVYKTAIDEYKADVKANPDAFKEMLQYKGE